MKSTGKVIVSGIDKIEKDITLESVIELDLPEGYYGVKAYIIAWDEEPGSYLENGEISPDALSDFVIIIKSNANLESEYRTRIYISCIHLTDNIFYPNEEEEKCQTIYY